MPEHQCLHIGRTAVSCVTPGINCLIREKNWRTTSPHLGKRSYILSSLTTGILSSYLTSQTLVPRIKRQSTGGILMSVHCNSYIVRLLGATQIVISRYPSYSLVITQLFCKSKLYLEYISLYISLANGNIWTTLTLANAWTNTHAIPRPHFLGSSLLCSQLSNFARVFSSTSRPGGRTIGKAMMATPTFGRMCWPSRNSLTSPNSRIRKVVGSQKCQERVNNRKNQKGWNQVFPLVSIRRPYNLSIINIRCLWRLISKARCGRSWVTSIGGRNVYQPRSSILLWKVVDLSASIK